MPMGRRKRTCGIVAICVCGLFVITVLIIAILFLGRVSEPARRFHRKRAVEEKKKRCGTIDRPVHGISVPSWLLPFSMLVVRGQEEKNVQA